MGGWTGVFMNFARSEGEANEPSVRQQKNSDPVSRELWTSRLILEALRRFRHLDHGILLPRNTRPAIIGSRNDENFVEGTLLDSRKVAWCASHALIASRSWVFLPVVLRVISSEDKDAGD